jgi:transaldolase
MKQLFLDAANLEAIKKYHAKGIISGVTTNPSLIAKEPRQNFDNLIKSVWDYCAENDLSFSVEVFTLDPVEIEKQSKELHKKLLSIHNKPDLLHIKIPIGLEELQCIYVLANQNININCTCCFTEMQMQLAAKAGAKYVSLFLNRAKDLGIDVIAAMKRTKIFIEDNNLNAKIIAGSIRKGADLSDAWDAGADIVTCGLKAIDEALYHGGTIKSMDGFLKDFNAWIN